MIYLLLILILSVSPLHQALRERIHRDLAPFNAGITEDMIYQAQTHAYTCLVIIKNHTLEEPHCFMQKAHQSLFRQLAPQLPDLQFVINHIDEPRVLKRPCLANQDWKTCACDNDYRPDMAHGFFIKPVFQLPIYELLPIFSGGTISQCFADILIPSFYHLQFGDNRPQSIPWEKKQFGAVWRGTSTGGEWTPQWPHFRLYHRQRLVQLCFMIDDCDAKFAGYLSCSPEMCQAMQERYGRPNFLPMDVQFRKKIIIDIDGNTFSRRFPYYLLSGSVVFKIAVFEDIGTLLTKPWQHYVPIKMDLSDLEEKMEWARQNDDQMVLIGKRGKRLSEKEITMATYKCYLKYLLQQYHKLLVKGGVFQQTQ